MRVVFMGSPEFAIPALQFLMLGRHQIAAVYTRADKPAGRGRASASPPIKEAAISLGLPVVQVPSFKNPESVEQLARFKPEAIVVAAFGQILPPSVLEIPYYGCINIHPSLLPQYRGASPVTAAILAGDEFSGVSVMRLDAGMDTGPVFSRAQIPILPQDNSGSLTAKLFQIGARMLLEVLAELPQSKRLPEPQDNSAASYTREIAREEGRIDWTLPAPDIWRRVRAYQPWPGAYTYWQGKQLKIIDAVALDKEMTPGAGKIVDLSLEQKQSGAAFGVGTGRGLLGIIGLQIEGKRVVAAHEFIRGQRNFMGAKLGDGGVSP